MITLTLERLQLLFVLCVQSTYACFTALNRLQGSKKGCIQLTVYLSTQTPSITNHSFLQKEYLPTLKNK